MQLLENEEEDDFVSFKRNSFSAFTRPSIVIETIGRKSFSYNKLPQEPLTLTILKLDGSSFEIVVPKMGTVVQLKQGVESAFSHLPKRGPGMVSWSHVWGHFCLCYNGQKLLTDSDYIGSYGIRDGDMLRFVRHISVDCNVVTERPVETSASDEPITSDSSKEGGQNSKEGVFCRERDTEKQQANSDNEKGMSVGRYCQYKVAYLLRGWFSYERLASSDVIMKQKNVSQRLSFSITGSFKSARHRSTSV